MASGLIMMSITINMIPTVHLSTLLRIITFIWTKKSVPFWRRLPEETHIIVISDHGVKKMDGGICINEWLRREGISNPI